MKGNQPLSTQKALERTLKKEVDESVQSICLDLADENIEQSRMQPYTSMTTNTYTLFSGGMQKQTASFAQVSLTEGA